VDQHDIISMANKVGFIASVSSEHYGDVPFVKLPHPTPKSTELFLMLRNFAALVAATEREECAKVCEIVARESGNMRESLVAVTCANTIRARGEK